MCKARYRAYRSDKWIAYLSRMIIASDREGEGHWGHRLTREWHRTVGILPPLLTMTNGKGEMG